VRVSAAERAVRASCPRAAIELRERADRSGWIHVVTYDGVEYAGSGTTAEAAWTTAASNLGVDVHVVNFGAVDKRYAG
jgi:hypothetical protein